MPYFKLKSSDYDNYKDTAKALVTFGVSLTGALTSGGGE